MKLTDLDPQFIVFEGGASGLLGHVDELERAQGIHFLCPCRAGHVVLVWFEGRGVHPELAPKARWKVSGAGYESLTLVPSIHMVQPCGWHGFVTSGDVHTV